MSYVKICAKVLLVSVAVCSLVTADTCPHKAKSAAKSYSKEAVQPILLLPSVSQTAAQNDSKISFSSANDTETPKIKYAGVSADIKASAPHKENSDKVRAATSKKSTGKTKKSVTASKAAFYPLTAAQREKIERVIMTSCGTLENIQMAKANAQVILDRLKDGRFGKTVDEVLDAPHQFETPWKGTVNNTVKEAVRAVFDRGERVTSMPIFYYENPYLREVDPQVWRKGKTYVMTLGHEKYIHEYWTQED